MEFSIKIKMSIIKNLNSIQNKEFDESNIKELLIDIREFIPQFDILREIADFVAHPSRDRGLCHADIDLTYIRMKFTIPKNNPQQFSLKIIPKKLYDTLLIKGIEKETHEKFLDETGITKELFKVIIKKIIKFKTTSRF